MSDFFKYPLSEEYTYSGKFSSLNDDHEYGGLLKYRPNHWISLQLATNSATKTKKSEIFHGQVFQDGEVPEYCTLLHCNAFSPWAGFSSNGGFKIRGTFKYLILGNTLDEKDIVTSYDYSTNLITCFFAPQGHLFEKYSQKVITFEFKGFKIKIWEGITLKALDFLPDAQFVSCSEGFLKELKNLIKKHKDEDGFGPAIKNKHYWVISIASNIPLLQIDEFDKIKISLDNFFFIITSHLSAATGLRIDVHHEDHENGDVAPYHVLTPVSTEQIFDKYFEGFSSSYDLHNPITYKSLGHVSFLQAIKLWEEKEDKFHYILQTLLSNHSDRSTTHSCYLFSRSVDALEAICELDGAKCNKQASKIDYAIETYASPQIKDYLTKTAGKSKSIKSTLAGERGKIVHPKSSHKKIWSEQRQFFNWSVALDSILHSYIQQKIGISKNLCLEFQFKMLRRFQIRI